MSLYGAFLMGLVILWLSLVLLGYWLPILNGLSSIIQHVMNKNVIAMQSEVLFSGQWKPTLELDKM